MTGEREGAIRRLRAEGHGVSAFARATGLTRRTVYRILGESGLRPGRRRSPTPGRGGADASLEVRRRRGLRHAGPGGATPRGTSPGRPSAHRPSPAPLPGAGRLAPPPPRAPGRSSAGSGPSPARSPSPPSPPRPSASATASCSTVTLSRRPLGDPPHRFPAARAAACPA